MGFIATLSKRCHGRFKLIHRQCLSTAAVQKRFELFEKEKNRQRHEVTRIEKIEVKVVAPPNSCVLVMNKKLSTPFNCAMHVDELHMQRSVLAVLNGKETWDIHRPLEDNCSLEFLHFKSPDPHQANLAFWRTGSFLLGYILENAFKETCSVKLCSFPAPDIASGSFVYDVELDNGLSSWTPSQEELACISRIGARLSYQDYKFERLAVAESLALEMFSDNPLKTAQIASIAAKKDGKVILYRMNEHIDITGGPLIATTRQLSHWFQITAFHPLGFSKKYNCNLHRVQAVAIPAQFSMHKWTFDFLANRAAMLNNVDVASNFSK